MAAAKKYQVFVSSTFKDLVNERQDVIRNILDLNQIPAGMELFPAADVEQLSYIKKIIDECDYYLLIVGGRYGSLDAQGVSFTEREYDYAVETGKFVIAFVHGEPDTIAKKNSETTPELAAALDAFREKVMKGRLVKTWKTQQDLQIAVLKSLPQAFNAFPQVGWIRGDAVASDRILEQTNKALQENVELREELHKIKDTTTDIPNIAGLNNTTVIRFTTALWNGYGREQREWKQKILWRDLFISLGAYLDTPTEIGVITLAIQLCCKDQIGQGEISEVNHLDRARIKAQFTALRLIETSIVAGVELLSLTSTGKRIFLEDIVARID